MQKNILKTHHMPVFLTSELALWMTVDRDDAVFL